MIERIWLIFLYRLFSPKKTVTPQIKHKAHHYCMISSKYIKGYPRTPRRIKTQSIVKAFLGSANVLGFAAVTSFGANSPKWRAAPELPAALEVFVAVEVRVAGLVKRAT